MSISIWNCNTRARQFLPVTIGDPCLFFRLRPVVGGHNEQLLAYFGNMNGNPTCIQRYDGRNSGFCVHEDWQWMGGGFKNFLNTVIRTVVRQPAVKASRLGPTNIARGGPVRRQWFTDVRDCAHNDIDRCETARRTIRRGMPRYQSTPLRRVRRRETRSWDERGAADRRQSTRRERVHDSVSAMIRFPSKMFRFFPF